MFESISQEPVIGATRELGWSMCADIWALTKYQTWIKEWPKLDNMWFWQWVKYYVCNKLSEIHGDTMRYDFTLLHEQPCVIAVAGQSGVASSDSSSHIAKHSGNNLTDTIKSQPVLSALPNMKISFHLLCNHSVIVQLQWFLDNQAYFAYATELPNVLKLVSESDLAMSSYILCPYFYTLTGNWQLHQFSTLPTYIYYNMFLSLSEKLPMK